MRKNHLLLKNKIKQISIILSLASGLGYSIAASLSPEKFFHKVRNSRNQQGWILIDAMSGILILSLALIAMMTVYAQVTKTNTTNRDYDSAIYFAQYHLENLKQLDGKPEIKSLSSAYAGPFHDTVTIDNTKSTITFTTTIAPIPSTAMSETLDSHIYPYQATVSWSTNKSIQISAYYYSN